MTKGVDMYKVRENKERKCGSVICKEGGKY